MQVERRAPPVVAGRLWLPAASPSPLTLGNVGLGGSGATLVPSLEGGVLAAGGARPPATRLLHYRYDCEQTARRALQVERGNSVNASDEHTKSLWMRIEVLPDASSLDGNLKADTLIVGSGFCGLSAAYELSQAGQKVIVVDRGSIAGGMTSRTTAHLAPICDDGLSTLVSLRGLETAKLFQQSQAAAVDRIEAIVDRHAIHCDFRRLDGYLFPAMEMDRDEARKEQAKEFEAAHKVGAAVEHAHGVPLKGFKSAPALRYPAQATFHPLKYLRAVAQAILDAGGQIFANSAVTKIEEMKGGVRVVTDGGSRVTADRAIFATNAPINDRLEIHSKMAPYRTYAMAFTVPRDTLPDALYWDMADPYHYIRLQPGQGSSDYLIVGGEDHKSGEADDGNRRFDAIESWIRGLVPALGKEVHRWSGQVMSTIDHCAFIGRNPGSERVFVSTGDSGQGITHGALAGMLLKDLILHESSPWEKTYDPARKTVKGIVNYVSENVTALKNFAENFLPGDLDFESLDRLKPGEGGILHDGMHRLAACRDKDGTLHVQSGVCTHLGCHVNWNSTEQCWDCPCHGSQFAPDGTVLNGPALAPLTEAKAPAAKRRA
jgi:glycine/D-amino acid oxidase-like deaminating enzyme/nitrite reductase/ring-hydroxylating ferredoxin subunit